MGSRIGALKRLVQVLAETPLFSKGQVADETIKQAVDVLEDHDERLDQVERYIRSERLHDRVARAESYIRSQHAE
ncbi:MAG: hypothetical protein ABW094_06480 [Candidatus Thiodiazotropha sp.]